MATSRKIYAGGYWSDLNRASWIMDELENLGYQIVSRESVLPGDQLETALVELLDEVMLALVFAMPYYEDHDPWVDRDPEYRALSEARKRGTRVVPVITEHESSLPGYLDQVSPLRLSSRRDEINLQRLKRVLQPAPASIGRHIRRPPRTGFKSLVLGKYRCFSPSQSLQLGDSRWTVILGDNGTGKTTLLRVLASFSGNTDLGRAMVSPTEVSLSGGSELHHVTSANRRAFDRVLPDCIGFGAGRGTRIASLGSEESDPCLTLFEDGATLPDPEEWLLQADYSAKLENDPWITERLRSVARIIVKLLPDVSGIHYTTDLGRARVEVTTPDGQIPMRDLSFGYRTAMTWVVDLARRLFELYPMSENPLSEYAVVLVDEIDLHLHPRWQRHLLSLLDETFPKCQFIVTAHSPLIVQAAPDANIVLLRRGTDGVVIENNKDYIRNWRVDQILASELFLEQPVHAPEVQSLLDRRALLLAKPSLTQEDQQELEGIHLEAREFSSAALPEDIEALDLIAEAKKALLQ